MKKQRVRAIIGVLAFSFCSLAWAGERTVTLKVAGMSCALCPPAARKALEKVDGVKAAHVEGDQATVVADDKVKDTDLVKAIKGAGFSATVVN